MAYKALYREYRPRRFEDLKGQGAVSGILRNQVRSGEPSHAYVFIGPRGTGKTSTAKILAMALNCLDPQDGEPCLECENCKAALNDSMIDIIEIDAASNNSVDNARDIRDKINLLPVKGKYKIYIIDEVHMLSDSAYNALLKTIEEPPSYAVFILATTELNKLPKTILSRCQRFDFKNIDTASMTGRMREVLDNIGKTADDDALAKIAEYADGGMRDALTVLEKCTILADHIDRKTVLEVLNYADDSALLHLLACIRAYDGKGAIETLQAILDSGIEPNVAVSQLLSALRKIMRASVGIDVHDAGFSELAKYWDRASLIAAIETFAETDNAMKLSTKPAILLEARIMGLLLPEAENDAGLAARVAKLEEKLENGVMPIQIPVSGETERVEPQAESKPEKKARKKREPISDDEILPKLIERMHPSMLYGGFIDNLYFVEKNGHNITASTDDKTLAMLLESADLIKSLNEELRDLTGEPYILKYEKAELIYDDNDVEIVD